jgi:hypothetical protein
MLEKAGRDCVIDIFSESLLPDSRYPKIVALRADKEMTHH